MLDKIIKGKQAKPRRILIYGVHGVGKSTLAAKFPTPIFVPTEDGLADIDCDSFPICRELMECWSAIAELGRGEHQYKTVVVDSVDWLERLAWRHLCQSEGKESIADFPYGQGYAKAAKVMGDILGGLSSCRENGMHVVIIAHSDIKRFENPAGDSYDRYQPKLHHAASALVQEWCDEVLFANYEVHVRKTGEGLSERGVGLGSGERVLHCTEQPAAVAKNRLGLPDTLPMHFEALAKYFPKLNKTEKS